MCRLKLTKQQENCPYCHGYDYDGYLIKDGWLDMSIFDSNKIILRTDPASYEVPINYCPMCGRPLNEEEE